MVGLRLQTMAMYGTMDLPRLPSLMAIELRSQDLEGARQNDGHEVGSSHRLDAQIWML